MVADERTPLWKTEGGGPPYMFITNPNRAYRKRIHQFQCLLCSLFLLLFTFIVIVTVLQSVDEDVIDNNVDNSTGPLQLLLSQKWPLKDKGVGDWDGTLLNPADVQSALFAGKESLEAKDQLEDILPNLPVDSPSYKHQLSVKTSPQATYLARTGYMLNVATKKLIEKSGKKVQGSVGRTESIKDPLVLYDVCSKQNKKTICEVSPYRAVDGTCNSLKRPSEWGVSMQPFRRVLEPDYGDGVSLPRQATDGSDLPSAREVSVIVHRPDYRGDEKFTAMLAVWGQFLDHDLTATALSQGKDGKTIPCCGLPKDQWHPECFPVKVPAEDPYFNVTCLEFVRSAPAPTCAFGPREQLNQASSFLDASVVYGNTEKLSKSLRTGQNGQLRMTVTPDGRTLLPQSFDPSDGCNNEEENAKGRFCFDSGDARANENIHLTTMHLIMARQHNSIATQLSSLNPSWDDDKVYQESRKIVGAQMQHITYTEFLPVILGSEIMEKLNLVSQKDGKYYNGYDPSVDPTISNNFATASFRFAHTLLPGLMKLISNTSSEEAVDLYTLLFDPYKLYAPGYLDSALKGAMNTPLERMDNKEITQKLFKQPSKNYGLDLVSLNIQRGRDHGLAAYPEWREHCGLSKPKTFNDLRGQVDDESLNRISTLYKSVDDVDLYTGALSEIPLKDALLGPTLTCLIGDQFKRVKDGDRYWYETPENPQAFSTDQLAEIHKTSLAGIICNSADDVTETRSKVMEGSKPGNQVVPCTSIPQPDLTAWSEFVGVEASNPSSTVGSTSVAFSIRATKITLTKEDGSVIFEGEPPFQVPVSALNGLPLFGVGVKPLSVQWDGAFTFDSPDTLSFTGQFSVFTFPHGFIIPPYSPVNWINGKINLEADLIWNNTDLSLALNPAGVSYNSLLFFSNRPPKFSPDVEEIPKKFVLVNPTNTPPVRRATGLSTRRSSIILTGSYSLGKLNYLWNGNATVILPILPPPLPSLETQNLQVIEPSLEFPSTAVVFEITVTKLIVTSQDSSVYWTRSSPVDIPVSLFNISGISTKGIKPLTVQWSGAFSFPSPGKLSLSGQFSVFTFPHGNLTPPYSTVNWVNGNFDLEADLNWNNTDLALTVPSSISYSSLLFFSDRPSKIVDSLTSSSATTLKRSSIILSGSYSLDKLIYYWTGNATVVLPIFPPVSPVLGQIQDTKISDTSVSPSTVFSFKVSEINVESEDGTSIWSGHPPSIVPVYPFDISALSPTGIKPLSVQWAGTFLFSEPGKLSLSAQFSTFTFPHGNLTPPYTPTNLINGKVTLEADIIWNNTDLSLSPPGAITYNSLLFFSNRPLRNVTNSKENFVLVPPERASIPGASLRSIIILTGSYTPDKLNYLWSGNVTVTLPTIVPLLGTGKATKPKPKPAFKKQIGLQLLGGKVTANPSDNDTYVDNLWSGSFPIEIPLSAFPSDPNGDNNTISWTASYDTFNLQGSFSFPKSVKNETGVEEVEWWDGNFNVKIAPLWFTSLDGLIIPGKTYQSKIFFQGNSTRNKTNQSTKPPPTDADPTLLTPIILIGNFSADNTTFIWSGKFLVSFRSVKIPGVVSMEKLIQLPKTDPKPTRVPKAPRPTKGPKPPKPIKESISFTVTSGNIWAGFEDENKTEVWNGALPATVTIDDALQEGAFTPTATVSWSGSGTSDSLEGTFVLPTKAINGTKKYTRNWTGNFSIDFEVKWTGDMETFMNSKKLFKCKLMFKEPKKFVLGSDDEIGSESDGVGTNLKKAPLDLNTQECNIIVFGTFYKRPFYCPVLPFFCEEGTIFTWNGEAIMTKILPPPPVQPTLPPNALQFPGVTHTYKKIIGRVLSGSLTAGLPGSSKSTLWSGSIPVAIPLPVFWTPVTNDITSLEPQAYGHGAIWSGSAFGATVHGTFSLPQYTWNGVVSSIRWWDGEFSAQVQSLWEVGLGPLVIPGIKYNSRIIFRDMRNGTFPVFPSTLTSPDQYEINSAYRAPFILLGTYSNDRKTFFWHGDFILVFYNVPDMYFYK